MHQGVEKFMRRYGISLGEYEDCAIVLCIANSDYWFMKISGLNNLFVFSFIHSFCLAICLYSEYMLQTYSLSSTMINVKSVRTKNNNLNCTSFPASIKIFFSLFEAENSASYNYWLSFSKKIHLPCHNGVCIGMLVCILTLLG